MCLPGLLQTGFPTGNSRRFDMKLLKTLNNPFLLAAEGFVAGAILFWSTMPQSAAAAPDSRPTAPAPLSEASPR